MLAFKHGILFLIAVTYARICSAARTENFVVTTIIQNHFAETRLGSKITNDLNISAEVGFQIMLPREAFITHFKMTINGTDYEGKIEEKEKAQMKFNAAKQKGQSTGLLETREKAEKIFSTSVNIGANTAVEFTVVYQQLLRKIGGKYTNKIILFRDQLSRGLRVNIYICEPRAVKNITVPPILLNGVDRYVDVDPTIQVGDIGYVSYGGNDQLKRSAISAEGGVFTVTYKLEKSENPSEVIVDNGYFIYFGPDVEVKPKRMIFVLDDSGSMSGHKSNQVKTAMSNIIKKLISLDRFGVVKFSSTVRTWLPKLVEATSENILAGIAYVKSVDEGAGTQIWLGLERALEMMIQDTEGEEEDPAKNMIVLLSDGHGSLSLEQLVSNVQQLANNRYAIHTISFGGGADDRLLKEVANQNHGRWNKILVDLDSALQIENYVDEIRNSELEEICVVDDTVITESYSTGGEGELVSVGKFHEELQLHGNGPHEITCGDFDGDRRSQFFLDQKDTSCGGMGGKQIKNFAAKAFGMKKVQLALEELERQTDSERKQLYKEKAVNLSIQYKLVTPVTSMLVIKPDVEKEIEEELAEEASLITANTPFMTTTALPNRGQSNAGGIGQAHLGGSAGGGPMYSLHSDPHFIARLSNDITVCFNWKGRNNEIVNLLHDTENSIVINGLMTGQGEQQLYVTKLMFLLERDEVFAEISPDGFVVGDFLDGNKGGSEIHLSLREIDRRSVVFGILKFRIAEIRKNHVLLKIRIRKILFVVEIHFRRNGKPNSRDHLDLAIPYYQTVSRNLGGIFGHLQMRNFIDVGHAEIIDRGATNRTYLLYNNHQVEVHKSHMRIPYLKTNVDCWFSGGHLDQLLGATLESFHLGYLEQIPGVA